MEKDKQRQPLLSVIITVYNTEKFLHRCLDSVICQTYKNLEIILIDDGSQENENAIIQEYMSLDNRIKLIKHDTNQGLFQARITGIEASRGDYFAFVDSDDSISIDYYRLLANKASETNADIVIADFANEYEDGTKEYYNLDATRLQDLNLEKSQVLETFMRQQGLFYGWHTIWNKIYSADLWKKCGKYLKEFSQKTGHLIMTEDIAYSCVFWSFAEKVTNTHNAYYFYSRHEKQSIVVKEFEKLKKNLSDGIKVFDFFKEILLTTGNWDKFEGNYNNFRDLYIKYWCSDCDKLAEKDFKKGKNFVLDLFKIKDFVYTNKDDAYFYNLTTDFSKEFNLYENIKKAIISYKKEYISFDIFDTLILRPVLHPSDIFRFLNFDFNRLLNSSVYIDFAEIRKNAEDSARKLLRLKFPSWEDVNLDEIYDYIKDNYTFDVNITDFMKRREIELETEFCTQRNTGKELYELAKYYGKKIIFVSDMYLPSETINAIMTKNGYEGELFLSSETRFLKGTGNLYKYVLDKLGTDKNNILHIGDNLYADVEAPKTFGIDSYYIPKTTDLFFGKNPDIYSGNSFSKIYGLTDDNTPHNPDAMNLGIRCMLALAANKMFDNPYIQPFHEESDFNANPYYIGYYALGTHLYAAVNQLIETAKNKRTTENIHFCMRDGYLPQKAYEILTSDIFDAPKSKFVYFTRKSMLGFLFAKPWDIYSVTKQISVKNMSPEKFINMMKSVIKKEKLMNINDFFREKKIVPLKNFGDDYDFFLTFIKLFQEELIDYDTVEKYREKFKNFADKNIKENDIIFDMGYSGRNEFFISKILEKPVKCFYIHTNSDDCIFRSTLAKFEVETFYDFKPDMCVVIREHLFSKSEPSCVGFDIETESDGLNPVFEEYNHNYQTDFVTKIIQNAALDFIGDMKNIFGKYKDCIIYKNICASVPYEFFMSGSNQFDMKIFDSSYFEDDVFGGRNINFYDFWQNERCKNNYNRIFSGNANMTEKIVEIKVPLGYETFLEGKSKLKKAMFLWLFDKKLFRENLVKIFKRK